MICLVLRHLHPRPQIGDGSWGLVCWPFVIMRLNVREWLYDLYVTGWKEALIVADLLYSMHT